MKNSTLASGFAFFPSPLTQPTEESDSRLADNTKLTGLPSQNVKKISVKGKEDVQRNE